MIFETVKSEGIAHFSYLIGDDGSGEAVVIDPRRDIDIYLELAHKHGLRILYALETHIHADFVSGSLELADRTGCTIGVGPADDYGFDHRALEDGEEVTVGQYTLRVLHTPGHTPEHVCYLISGGTAAEAPWGLFTGDLLFAGEVGRPDLLGKGTERKLAFQLFDSLHEIVLELPDDLVIYPAHGEGSPCGASIGSRSTSTIGYERRNNDLLNESDQERFVKRVMESLSPAPKYYPRMKKINAAGPELLGALPHMPALTVEKVSALTDGDGCIIVDCREIEAFGGAHIDGSINIPLRSSFPIWAGRILDPEREMVLVLPDKAHWEEAQRHLLRVGFEKVAGYLRQGVRSWLEAGRPFRRMRQLSVHELHERIRSNGTPLQVLDVRTQREWENKHIPSATHIALPDLSERVDELERDKPVAVYCGSGYRASIAASLLERAGFEDVSNVPGSITAWTNAGLPLKEPSAA